jgi:hypothetical protein
MSFSAAALASVPVFALGLITAAHIILARLQPQRLPWWSLSIAAAAGLIFAAAITAYVASLGQRTPWDLAAYVVVNAGCTAALAFGYFNFVNLNFTSLRVRILREMGTAGDFSIADLKARYGADAVLDLRLKRLVDAGELSFDGAVYRLGGSRKILMIGIVLDHLKAVIMPKTRNGLAHRDAPTPDY